MRVSSVAWICEDIRTVREMARLTASVSHNHPEGYKGAEAVASAIYLARTGDSKEEIRSYIGANDSSSSLAHYGMPRRSGRYPWGSGEDPYQHSKDFLHIISPGIW